MKASVERVRRTLRSMGLTAEVREFSESTRTAAEAAAAIGTTVGQIAKSLVFMAGDEPVLVLASGANRVDMEKMRRLLGKKITRPDAETVREVTGFSIGGVPPVGHAKRLRTFVDEDLLSFPIVYAAAGTPNVVFAVSPRDLIRMTEAEVVQIKEA
ncbi:MAG: YbaK/EbsC family protein [Thermoplasmata archaeon]|nr:YbaK/EbsC family protein [Thermoplasmata archaeon]NIS11046.1 YbaK/EbsC family protein [Thermoplasmata archaeon]